MTQKLSKALGRLPKRTKEGLFLPIKKPKIGYIEAGIISSGLKQRNAIAKALSKRFNWGYEVIQKRASNILANQLDFNWQDQVDREIILEAVLQSKYFAGLNRSIKAKAITDNAAKMKYKAAFSLYEKLHVLPPLH